MPETSPVMRISFNLQVSRGHVPGYVIYYEKSTISPRDELVNLLHFSGLDCDPNPINMC